ncbi:MAG: nuclear transport factor 2 family protein [Novosphingobium sp.]|nr:nuclear transport factor 2 family protein [Novosphingobium sp.]
MSSTGNDALALARQVIDGLERKDEAAVIAVLHEDVVLHVPFPLVEGENTTGTRRQTGEAVHRYLEESNELTETVRFNNIAWRTTDDGLALFQADGEVLLRDGRPYRNHYLFLFEAKNGKISQWWEYYNPVIAAIAFGAPLESIPG